MIWHDVECVDCERVFEDVDVKGGIRPCPECGGKREILFTRLNCDDFQPHYFKSIDREFTKSELKDYLKLNNCSIHRSADKHHGARNEDHLHLGKIYSYPGQRGRSSYSDRYGKD